MCQSLPTVHTKELKMAKLCSPAYFCLSNGQPIVESKGTLKQAKLDVPTEQVQVGRMIQFRSLR
jgi:hypothetical protein